MFGKLYAPELLMGLQSAEEVEDIIDADVIEAEPSHPRRRDPKPANQTGWSLEAMEEFDDLMDKAYRLYKENGYAKEYESFAEPWRGKRGKSEAGPTITELRAVVDGLEAAAAHAKAAAQPEAQVEQDHKSEPTTEPTHKNPDDKIRRLVEDAE
jgi:hypothetical protein